MLISPFFEPGLSGEKNHKIKSKFLSPNLFVLIGLFFFKLAVVYKEIWHHSIPRFDIQIII